MTKRKPQQLATFTLMRQQFQNQCCNEYGEVAQDYFMLVNMRESIEGICDTLWNIIEEQKITELYEEHDTSVIYDTCGQALKDFILSKQ